MKKILSILLLLPLAAFAAQPKNIQKDNANDLTESFDIPTGKAVSFLSGSTLSLAGTLSGTPSAGTLNLASLTLTLPATVSGGTSSFQPLATVLTNTTAAFTTAQETKLAGIATGATLNDTDANLRARSSHTGEQAISTVTGLQAALDAGATFAALVAVNASGVNTDGLVEWSQLVGVPAGFADGTDDGAGGGSGTVTATGGNLTLNAIVLGAGVVDTKVAAGLTTDGTSALNLGVAGASVGKVVYANATSGTVTMQPVTGALGSNTISIPAATDTLGLLAASQAFTNKTYNGLTLTSTTGTLTITNAKTFSVSNTLTLAGTDGSTLNIGTGGTLGSAAYTASTAYLITANNLSELTGTAGTARTNLGGTTVGQNVFTLTNPSAVTWFRINADNTVTSRTAAETKTDLSLNNVENTALSTWAGSGNLITLGAATATSINGLTLTSSTGVLTIASGKTATVSNTLTMTGTDSASVAFGGGGTVRFVEDTDTAAERATAGFVSTTAGGLETRQAHGDTGATETFDLANGNWHTATLDQNSTFTLLGFTSGKGCSMLMALLQGGVGGFTVTWPAAVVAAPTVNTTAGAITWISLWSEDGGTTIYASSSEDGLPSDTAFASSWNGVTTAPPTKNAVYDWGHTFDADDDGLPDKLDLGTAGLVRTTSGGVISSAEISGDATTSGSNALTLATVNSNVGTFGSATEVASVTLNAKGLVTAGSNVTVTPAVGSITGLGTGVATALAVNAGSSGAFLRRADRVVSFPLTIGTLADSQNYMIGYVPAAFTITHIYAVHSGTGLSSPSILLKVYQGTDRSSGTAVVTAGNTVTSSTTGSDISTFDDATCPAGSWLWITTGSKSGTTAQFEIVVTGTYD